MAETAPEKFTEVASNSAEAANEAEMRQKALDAVEQWVRGFNSKNELKNFANNYYYYDNDNNEYWSQARSDKTKKVDDVDIDQTFKTFSRKDREMKVDNIEIRNAGVDTKSQLSFLSEIIDFQRKAKYDERFERINSFHLGNDIGYIIDVTTSTPDSHDHPRLSSIIFNKKGEMIMGYFDIKM